jgi:DNA topoisomerase-1
MVVKRKGRQAFLGCQRYPDCEGTGPIPDGIHLEAPPKPPPKDTGLTCPKCGKKALVIRQGPRGEFVACSGFPRCRNSFNLNLLDEVSQAIADKKDAQAIIDAAKGSGTKAKKKTKKKAKKKSTGAKKKAKKATASAEAVAAKTTG